MKRYDLAGMEKDDRGLWVKHSEAKVIIEERDTEIFDLSKRVIKKDAEIKKLRAALKEIRDCVPSEAIGRAYYMAKEALDGTDA